MLERSSAYSPLSEVRQPFLFPLREERLRYITPEELHVAHHEFGHWLVGFSRNYQSDISMTPYGYSRARTMFYGSIDNRSLSEIAAAGAVSTPYGAATGYGMDMYVLDYLTGGNPSLKSDALVKAAAVIFSYPEEVRRRAAELIAFLGKNGGVVTNEIMYYILRQATQEAIDEEKDLEKQQRLRMFYIPPKERFITNRTITTRTLIETGEGLTKIVVLKDNKEEELFSCAICGTFEGPHNDEFHRRKEFQLKNKK